MRRVVLAILVLVAMVVPAMAQSVKTMQKLEDQWSAAFNKGDAAAVAAMYTDDAYVLPAGAPMVHGTANIQTFWSQTMQQLGDLKCTTMDVRPLGRNWAREIGNCAFKTKGAAPADDALKYVIVWQKVDGQWKVSIDIGNMDK
jgi:uncharacterized protein (TIGR02246 family)